MGPNDLFPLHLPTGRIHSSMCEHSTSFVDTKRTWQDLFNALTVYINFRLTFIIPNIFLYELDCSHKQRKLHNPVRCSLVYVYRYMRKHYEPLRSVSVNSQFCLLLVASKTNKIPNVNCCMWGNEFYIHSHIYL